MFIYMNVADKKSRKKEVCEWIGDGENPAAATKQRGKSLICAHVAHGMDKLFPPFLQGIVWHKFLDRFYLGTYEAYHSLRYDKK